MSPTHNNSNMADEEGETAPMYGDVLDAVVSALPLVDLLIASCVSRAWKRTVSSSLAYRFDAIVKPWLILHAQDARSLSYTAMRACDPRSGVWLHIGGPKPSLRPASLLRSSDSALLYTLSPFKLSFSSDPLHLEWHHAVAPRMWRRDPVVALVGSHLVVAGGGCGYEDDPLAVEVYHVDALTWRRCPSMPATLKDSAAATWLSVATNGAELFLTEKATGVTHSFDPEAEAWRGPYYLRPDPAAFYTAVGFSGDRMIVVGLLSGDGGGVGGVKVFEVVKSTWEGALEVIGEMPEGLVEKCGSEVAAVRVCVTGEMVYVYDSWGANEVVFCELGGGGGGVRRWGSVGGRVFHDDDDNKKKKTERVVYTCSKVGIQDVQRALIKLS